MDDNKNALKKISTNKIIKNLSNSDYHKESDHISSSKLKKFISNADEYHSLTREDLPPQSTSDSMIIGEAIHCILLEPDFFNDRFLVLQEKINKTTKIGKEKFLQITMETNEKNLKILTKQNSEIVEQCRKSVLYHPIAVDLIADAETEISFFCHKDHVLQKVRCDGIKDDIIFDIKTTDDVNYFYKSVIEWNYDMSSCMYKNVVSHFKDVKDFYFIVVQKKYPYTTMVCSLDNEFIIRGERNYRQALMNYVYYINDGLTIKTINAPSWLNGNMQMY